MEKKYEAVEWFEYNGYGAYIVKLPYPCNIMFNYNDICDLLDFKYQRRIRMLDKMDILHKTKLWFKRDGRDSEETFISVPELSRILSDYGINISVMMERKYNVENLVYHALNEFDAFDKNKEEDYSLGDKFVLNTLYCDSVIADKANSNLINLLRQNDLIEHAIHHTPDIDYKEKHDHDCQIEEFIHLCNELNNVNSQLQKIIDGVVEPVKSEIDLKALIEIEVKYMGIDDERKYL